MMLEFKKPIPVHIVSENEKGYALYVTNSGAFENDVWRVVLCNGGHIRHYRSNQIKMYVNLTFDIEKNERKEK
jgi:hypothetical protein